MSEPTCAFTKPDGHPCAARPLPGSPFCLFHDPAHAQAQTEARSKGGSTPRRRTRRVPRLLDHYQIAELLGELFVDALNRADPTNPKCLNAITHLARTLLKAVGAPNDQYLEHGDWSEPSASADHLIRVYPPLPAEVEALLEAEPSTAPAPPGTTDPSDPEHLNTRTPESLNTPTPERLNGEQALNRPTTAPPARDSAPLPPHPAAAPPIPAQEPPIPPPAIPEPTSPATPHPLNTPTPERLTAEQDPDRSGTGPAATPAPAPPVSPPGPCPPSPQHPNASTPPGLPAEPDSPIQNPESKIQNPESPGISSLRRVTHHPPAGASFYGPAPGYVIRDTPAVPRRP